MPLYIYIFKLKTIIIREFIEVNMKLCQISETICLGKLSS